MTTRTMTKTEQKGVQTQAMAIRKYSERIQINPEDAEAYFMRGLTYYYGGNYAQAADDYIKAARCLRVACRWEYETDTGLYEQKQ